jgi:cobalt transporter subunit CbtB
MQNHVSSIDTSRTTTASTSIARPLQLIGALFLGAVILYGVGFSHMSAAHNAAHDTRHSAAFPCH